MIRIIIVDDEILSRVGLQSFFDGEEDIVVSGTFDMAADAIVFLEKTPVDVVITDIEMEEINGLDFIQVIREKSLANGVIIVSCHDDFTYAQEAISRGTDSYILKHSVTKSKLVEEVKKVFEKNRKNVSSFSPRESMKRESLEFSEDSSYCIAVVRYNNWEMEPETENVREETMLVHLLEDIVEHYRMGTFFAPLNRERFIMFRFEKDISEENLKRELLTNLQTIEENVYQYIGGSFSYGIGSRFTDLTKTREQYQEALAALDQHFFDEERTFYFWRKEAEEWEPKPFTAKGFLEPKGIELFEEELAEFIRTAARKQISVSVFQENLIHNLNHLIYQLFELYPLQGRQKILGPEFLLVSAVTEAKSSRVLETKIRNRMRDVWSCLREELKKDELSEILLFFEQNLSEKITLNELAEKGCMSVSSFCKKFKERMDMTPVQYMNMRRIEKAKILLKNKNYSLWEVADCTGFHNANYLVRVFKKVTGQTVSEYRSRYGITDAELQDFEPKNKY